MIDKFNIDITLSKKPKRNFIKIKEFYKSYKNGFFYKEKKESPFRDPDSILEFKMHLKEIVNEENFFNDKGKY